MCAKSPSTAKWFSPSSNNDDDDKTSRNLFNPSNNVRAARTMNTLVFPDLIGPQSPLTPFNSNNNNNNFQPFQTNNNLFPPSSSSSNSNNRVRTKAVRFSNNDNDDNLGGLAFDVPTSQPKSTLNRAAPQQNVKTNWHTRIQEIDENSAAKSRAQPTTSSSNAFPSVPNLLSNSNENSNNNPLFAAFPNNNHQNNLDLLGNSVSPGFEPFPPLKPLNSEFSESPMAATSPSKSSVSRQGT